MNMGGVFMYKGSLSRGSIKMFDSFVESKEETMLIPIGIEAKYKGKHLSFKLVVTKNGVEKYRNIPMKDSWITFSELKKSVSALPNRLILDDIEEILSKDINEIHNISLSVCKLLIIIKQSLDKKGKIKEKDIIKLKPAIILHAQSSDNRTGYGWEWRWDQLVCEGTLYGETSDFPIVGLYINYYL